MKFEKVNNDKIKITLSMDDLKANDIDFHSFMANSQETESLFLAVLDKAERDYGFSTDNYDLKVETLALDSGSFIVTITRSRSEDEKNATPKKRFRVSRKSPSNSFPSLIYKFATFEDFCQFVESLSSMNLYDTDKISKISMLYSYNNSFYLVLDNISAKYPNLTTFSSCITEFATYVNNSPVFIAKLHETGALVIKNHAIKVCNKYFS